MDEKTKICSRCHKWLPVTEFYASSTRSDGSLCYCKSCCAKRNRENYRKDPDKFKKKSYEYIKSHPERYSYSALKARRDEQENKIENKILSQNLGGIKALVLNHPSHNEPKYQIVEYGESTVYKGYTTAIAFLKALEEKIK